MTGMRLRVSTSLSTRQVSGRRMVRVVAAIRVLVVEDHRVLAESLEFALNAEPGLEVVGLAGTCAEAVRVAATAKPDVALLDFHLPDGNGADLAATLRKRSPSLRIVMLTGDAGDDAMAAAVSAGAVGYLEKSRGAADVVEAIRRAAAGEILVPAAKLTRLLEVQRRRASEQADHERLARRLTPREREVLQLMFGGKDNRTIAEALVISLTTVRGHVQAILEKLEAHSKLEAVAKAAAVGLIDR